jgi:hypothetical protein
MRASAVGSRCAVECMIEFAQGVERPAAVGTLEPRPLLADTLRAFKALQLHVEVCTEPPERAGWLDPAALAAPDSGPLASLLERFRSSGVASNRRAASASLLLRYGWGAGFSIAAYLTSARVPFLRDYAMFFSSGALLKTVWIRDAQFVGRADDPFAGGPEWIESTTPEVLRERLLQSLVAVTEPIIASQHTWSRFSRHALWAMVTSSWAAQFASVGRQLGDERRAVREAKAVFAIDPEIARAAPELYEVNDGGLMRTCQKLRSCCLYFKSSGRRFCSNCPIIPEPERLARNRAWIAAQRVQLVGDSQ